MRNQDEARLQGALVAFLRAALPSRAIVAAIPNGGSRDKREAAKLKWQGVLAGMPDLIVIIDGKLIGLELKALKGVLSGPQKDIGERFNENGFPWSCVRSLEQAEAFLRAHDVPLRATAMAA